MLISFVDSLLSFEIFQENTGRAFVGYISLRFTGPTRALIGRSAPAQVRGRSRRPKGRDRRHGAHRFRIKLALNPNFNRDPALGSAERVEPLAGGGSVRRLCSEPDRSAATWRTVLARLTRNGKLTVQQRFHARHRPGSSGA